MNTTTENLYSRLKELIITGKVSNGDYMQIVASAMQLAEGIIGMSGLEKKELVMNVIRLIVKDIPFDNVKQILSDTTVSNLIEVIIKVSRGEIKLNVPKKWRCC